MLDLVNLVLRLDARWCVDGVEMVHLDDPPGLVSRWFGKPGLIWFSCRSDRYKREIIREAVDLADDPLVVRFVNAGDDDKRIAFLSRFGLPEGFLLMPRDLQGR